MPRELNNVLSKSKKFHYHMEGKLICNIRKETNLGKQMYANPNTEQCNAEAHRKASYILANCKYSVFSVTTLK